MLLWDPSVFITHITFVITMQVLDDLDYKLEKGWYSAAKKKDVGTLIFPTSFVRTVSMTSAKWMLYCPVRHTLISRFMGPTWGPSGADRTQLGPMLAPWNLLSGYTSQRTGPSLVYIISCRIFGNKPLHRATVTCHQRDNLKRFCHSNYVKTYGFPFTNMFSTEYVG